MPEASTMTRDEAIALLKGKAMDLRTLVTGLYEQQITRLTSQIEGEYQYDDVMRSMAEAKRASLQANITDGLLTGSCSRMQEEIVKFAETVPGMRAYPVTMRYPNGNPIHELTIIEMTGADGKTERFLFDPSMRQFQPPTDELFNAQQAIAKGNGIATKEMLPGYRLAADPQSAGWYNELLTEGVVPFDEKVAAQYLTAFNQPGADGGARAALAAFLPEEAVVRALPPEVEGRGWTTELSYKPGVAPIEITDYRLVNGEVEPFTRTLSPEEAVARGYSESVDTKTTPPKDMPSADAPPQEPRDAAPEKPRAKPQRGALPQQPNEPTRSVPEQQQTYRAPEPAAPAASRAPASNAEAIAEAAMKDLPEAERMAVRLAVEAKDVSKLAKIGSRLGRFLPVAGVAIAGGMVAYVVLNAEKAHKEGKLTDAQFAAVCAGGACYTASAAGSIFTGIGGEEAIDASLKAAGVPPEYRFGTTREAIVGLLYNSARVEMMDNVPDGDVAALDAMTKDPNSKRGFETISQPTGNPAFDKLKRDLALVEMERIKMGMPFSASSGLDVQYSTMTDADIDAQREVALRMYFVNGGTVTAANVLSSGAPFEVSAETLNSLSKDVKLMEAVDGKHGSPADGKLDPKELGAFLTSLGVDMRTIDTNHDYTGDLGELQVAIVAGRAKASSPSRA